MTNTTDEARDLPTVDSLAEAATAIDARWAELERAGCAPAASDVIAAIADLAKAIGAIDDPNAKERENEYAALHAVSLHLRDALEAAEIATPGDPTVEFQRLLRLAEQEALRDPARGEALAKIADRWLSDALVLRHDKKADQ